jgi:hypothetical protein
MGFFANFKAKRAAKRANAVYQTELLEWERENQVLTQALDIFTAASSGGQPDDQSLEQLPDPNDPRVVLRELGAETCIAASFRGRATDEVAKRKVAELRAFAAKENIALSDETRICRFDPPFKPGVLQYNEIVIPAYL